MKISKKGGIAIFSSIGILMAAVIILHHNPGPSADTLEELVKKVLYCGEILVSCLIFPK